MAPFVSAQVAQSPAEANPVYLKLTDPAEDSPLRLSPSRFASLRSAEDQVQELTSLAAPRYRLEELLRPSAVAPYLLDIDRESPGSATSSLRRARVVFALHGELDTLSDERFLERLLGDSAVPGETGAEKTNQAEDAGQGGATRALTDAELGAAGIASRSAVGTDAEFSPKPPGDVDERGESHGESYRWVQAELFSRVRISGVVHSYWTRDGDSILWAVRTDERFSSQPDLKLSWERMERQAAGDLKVVERGDWAGGGAYLRISRWADDPKVLICEAELAWVEPRAWFGGSNLIASKLPPAIQSQVREIRRAALRRTE
ncbi:MAG: hypothetical protein EA381_02315 [Planctomycetaceae bacterium]|nr:MAG: hypothetical protein EA381_02315 [Planctomycetaceae bacterium]